MTISNYVQKKIEGYFSDINCSSISQEEKNLLKINLERDILFNLCEEMYSLISMSKYKVPEEADQKLFLEIVAKIETEK